MSTFIILTQNGPYTSIGITEKSYYTIKRGVLSNKFKFSSKKRHHLLLLTFKS